METCTSKTLFPRKSKLPFTILPDLSSPRGPRNAILHRTYPSLRSRAKTQARKAEMAGGFRRSGMERRRGDEAKTPGRMESKERPVAKGFAWTGINSSNIQSSFSREGGGDGEAATGPRCVHEKESWRRRESVAGCNERPVLSMHPPIRRIPYCIVARERNAQI